MLYFNSALLHKVAANRGLTKEEVDYLVKVRGLGMYAKIAQEHGIINPDGSISADKVDSFVSGSQGAIPSVDDAFKIVDSRNANGNGGGNGQGGNSGGQGNGQGDSNNNTEGGDKKPPAPPPYDPNNPGKNFAGLVNLPDDYSIVKSVDDFRTWFNGQDDAATAAGNRTLAYFAPRLVSSLGFATVAGLLAGRRGGVMVPLLGAIGGFMLGGPIMDLLQKMFGETPKPPEKTNPNPDPALTQGERVAADKQLGPTSGDPDDTSDNIELTPDQQTVLENLPDEVKQQLENATPLQVREYLQRKIDNMSEEERTQLEGLTNERLKNEEIQKEHADAFMTAQNEAEAEMERQTQDAWIEQHKGELQPDKILTPEQQREIANLPPEQQAAKQQEYLRAYAQQQLEAEWTKAADEEYNAYSDGDRQAAAEHAFSTLGAEQQDQIRAVLASGDQNQINQVMESLARMDIANGVRTAAMYPINMSQEEQMTLFNRALSQIPDEEVRAQKLAEFNAMDEKGKQRVLNQVVINPYRQWMLNRNMEARGILTQPGTTLDMRDKMLSNGKPWIDPTSVPSWMILGQNENDAQIGFDLGTEEGQLEAYKFFDEQLPQFRNAGGLPFFNGIRDFHYRKYPWYKGLSATWEQINRDFNLGNPGAYTAEGGMNKYLFGFYGDAENAFRRGTPLQEQYERKLKPYEINDARTEALNKLYDKYAAQAKEVGYPMPTREVFLAQWGIKPATPATPEAPATPAPAPTEASAPAESATTPATSAPSQSTASTPTSAANNTSTTNTGNNDTSSNNSQASIDASKMRNPADDKAANAPKQKQQKVVA